MTGLSWLQVVAGLILVVATFYDLFHSVVLPRPSVNRFILVRILFIALWNMWRAIGRRISNPARRESWLAVFGPAGVIVMFLGWGIAFMIGYAPLLDGV